MAVPLQTTIDSGPSGTVGSASATFAFSANSAGAGFECALDGAAFQPCASPYEATGLGDGAHTFAVRAAENGQVDNTPAQRTWTVDLSSPIVVDAEADATVEQSYPTTRYGTLPYLKSDTNPVRQALVKFQVGGIGAGREVTSAKLRFKTTNGSGNGPKVFSSDITWDEGTVTWDTKPSTGPKEVADIGSAPVGTTEYDVTSAVTTNGTYSFTLVPDSSDGVVFESRELASPPQLVVQTSAADTTPPETSIDSGPSGTVTQSSAQFAFSANENGALFECRVDGAAWAACTSPHNVTALSNGPHTFDVRATDAAGNTDATPASRTWTVSAALDTVIDTGPTGTVRLGEATFTFSATSPTASFECRLDAGAWQTCSSPRTETGLADGGHTFAVRAADNGTVDPTPASRTWTVDSTLAVVLTPTDDATVEEAKPNVNIGSSTVLQSDSSPVRHSYLKFTVDANATGPFTQATLRLYVTNGSFNGPVVATAPNAWSESTVTWGNRPIPSATPTADVGSVPADAWLEYDVTSAVSGSGTYTFAVVPQSSDGLFFSSREGAKAPQLVLR